MMKQYELFPPIESNIFLEDSRKKLFRVIKKILWQSRTYENIKYRSLNYTYNGKNGSYVGRIIVMFLNVNNIFAMNRLDLVIKQSTKMPLFKGVWYFTCFFKQRKDFSSAIYIK